MANDFFLNELRKGPEHWNQWVEEWIADGWQKEPEDSGEDFAGFGIEKRRSIDLSDAVLVEANLERADLWLVNLDGAHLIESRLEGADLRHAHLERARLRHAHLEGADLANAHLESASLWGAHLDRANLEQAHLEGADLRLAHLEGANLWGANLEGADLRDAHLEGANLWGANLARAFLSRANLDGADLKGANLKGATLTNAILDDADLTEAIGVEFDNNRINGVNFTAHPDKYSEGPWWERLRIRFGLTLSPLDDKWSLLRRNYTGSKMVLIWLALVAFVIPRIITGLWLYVLSSGNQLVVGMDNVDPTVLAGFSDTWNDWIDQHDQARVIKVFLGLTEVTLPSILWATLTVLLLLYTIVRFGSLSRCHHCVMRKHDRIEHRR